MTQNNGSQEDAKDIFHDGLIVLFNNVKKEGFTLNASLKSYLYSICRNLWLMKLRRAKNETRPIVSQIDQKNFRLTARLNYNITPDLTILTMDNRLFSDRNSKISAM